MRGRGVDFGTTTVHHIALSFKVSIVPPLSLFPFRIPGPQTAQYMKPNLAQSSPNSPCLEERRL